MNSPTIITYNIILTNIYKKKFLYTVQMFGIGKIFLTAHQGIWSKTEQKNY